MDDLFDDKIEALVKEKSFSELTLLEKEKVLILYSPEEYDELHNCLRIIKLDKEKVIQHLCVSQKNKNQLNLLYKKKHQIKFVLPSITNLLNIFYIPYFKPIIFTSCLLIVFAIVVSKFEKNNEHELTEEEFNKYTTFELEQMEPQYEMDETTEYLLNM
ncbi:MAG: hypothetical protein CO022_05115 [Flavobacteriales bacterium CG_4_9_14_0_2_um_filter_32_27]|nr:MAG: hypothetical protein CO022_05115 [Flavobacteriales bacterium CG_4_9_14_0_2_um_filter_32_27]